MMNWNPGNLGIGGIRKSISYFGDHSGLRSNWIGIRSPTETDTKLPCPRQMLSNHEISEHVATHAESHMWLKHEFWSVRIVPCASPPFHKRICNCFPPPRNSTLVVCWWRSTEIWKSKASRYLRCERCDKSLLSSGSGRGETAWFGYVVQRIFSSEGSTWTCSTKIDQKYFEWTGPHQQNTTE